MRVVFSEFVLDSDTRQLLRDGSEVHLSPKAFHLLSTLVAARPRAVSKDQLQATLWPQSFVTEGNLAVLMSEVRHALDDDPGTPRFVRTVPRFGYAFVAEAHHDAPGPIASLAPTSHWLVLGRRKFELREGESIIGRDPRCEVHLDLPGVSRRHARLLVCGARVTVEDLGSKNGTLRDGRRLTSVTALTDRDQLHFGPVAVRYRYWPARDTTVSAQALADE
jgi:DNA-binding winged helix-turn-helix (wHTH) protein